MPKRRLYRELVDVKSDGSDPFCIRGRTVDQGLILYVTAGSLTDETQAGRNIFFGLEEGNEFYKHEGETSMGKGAPYRLRKTHVFIGGERPVWMVEKAPSGNVLKGILEGYYEEARE